MSHDIDKLLSIMAQLRDPDNGCPWDRQQTFHSLTPYTLEEAYEMVETIERDSFDELPAELGDLLFQIVFYAQLGKEQQRFDFSDIVNAICEKLVRRHPHVFADAQVADAEEQSRLWEQHKAEERQQQAAQQTPHWLDGISHALPAMTRAMKLQKRVAQAGFDWPDHHGVMEKIAEELDEVRQALATGDQVNLAEELGDVLFSCVNLVRHCQQDPESVLRACNTRFQQRFNRMEDLLNQQQGLDKAEPAQMETIWAQVKRDKQP